MKSRFAVCFSSLALAALAACVSSNGGARTPDEFRVVTKAPLAVPPEYKLRPPQAGTAQPAEIDPERAQPAEAFGTSVGKNASASEKALVAAAGANAVSPVIREQIDFEEAKTIRKNRSATDRVLFWRKDKPEDAASAAEDNATGGAPVSIEKAKSGARLKLPGT
jgi:hypothetical protein